jgi:hypothetical protein
VLQDDAVRLGRDQQLGAAGTGRIAQRRLPFEHDEVRPLGAIAGDHRALELAAHEVVHRAVEDEAVLAALQPPGLPGVDHLGAHAGGAAGRNDDLRGGALAERAVGAEHGQARRVDVADGARPEAQLGARFGSPHVDDARAALRGSSRDVLVVAQEGVQPVDQADAAPGGIEQQAAELGRQHTAGCRDADDADLGLPDGRDQVVERGVAGNAARLAVERLACVPSGAGVIDDAEHPIPTRSAHQPVRRLGVHGREPPIRQNCGRLAHGRIV